MSNPTQFITCHDECEHLRAQIEIKDAKFDRLCKDFDERDAELKLIISLQRAVLEIIASTSSSSRIRRIANEALK